MVHIKNKPQNAKKSLKKTLIYAGIAVISTLLGFLAQNYMSSITKAIKLAFEGITTFISNVITLINDLNIFAMIFLLIALVFLMKATLSIKSLFMKQKDKDKNLFSKLPENYYMFSNFIIENTSIQNILICPKGIYTIHSKQVEASNKENSFAVVKQSILQSKTVNDFMQKNNIGNYYVKTIVTLDEVNDKVKQHFPELLVMQTDKLQQYLDSQETKYSRDECKKISLQLKSVVNSIDKNIPDKNMAALKIK